MIDLCKINRNNVGKLFDYSVLPKATTETEIRRGCLEAKQYGCAAFYQATPYWNPVVKAAGSVLTKVILEVCYLTNDEIVTACRLVAESGGNVCKNTDRTVEVPSMQQFLLIRDTLQNTDVKLKVAGVKFPRPQNAYAFILAGADLIGTRAAPEIIDALAQMHRIGLVPPLK